MASARTFFLARAANGALALLQAFLCLRVAGDEAAAQFFLAWTAAWLLATIFKFGADGVLPRAVAEARARERPPDSMRAVLKAGAALGAVALVPVAAALTLPVTPATLLWTALLATSWSGTLVLATLLRAHGRVGLGGVVAYVVWPLASVAAPALLLATGGAGHRLLPLTAILGLGALAIAVAATARALGRPAVAGLVSARRPPIPVDADVCGAALLTWLYELLVWLPVVLAAVTHSSAVVTGAAFAATRLVGVFSWGYQAVVATLTPRLADAIARGQGARAAALLRRGSLAGLALTAPACIAGALLAAPAMDLFDSDYASLSAILVWLALGRAADAAAGPVGEALLVGRKALLDAVLTGGSLLVAVLLGVALEPAVGPVAIGIGGAAAFVLANLLRVAAVRVLLRRGWRSAALRLRTPAARLAWLSLAASGGVAAGVLAAHPSAPLAIPLVCGAAVVAAGAIVLLAVRAHGLLAATTAPPVLIALVLVGHFALRATTIAADPDAATLGLRVLGFTHADIARAGAIGVLGLAALAAGFLLMWRPAPTSAPAKPTRSPSPRGLVASATLGSLLWLLLFVRLGGPAALLRDPASLHLGQFGGGYGTMGLALCFGAALLALDAWLSHGARAQLAIVGGAAGAGALGSVCLATRGPLVASVIAGAALVVSRRRLTRRSLAVGCVGAAVIVGLLGFGRAVREYAQVEPLPAAVGTAATTAPHRTVTADLVEFDHLVALTKVVPSGLDWLDGRSVTDVPAAFLPRALWPAKPLPIDFRLSETVYGPDTAAGTPFTLPGEAFWNFGVAGGSFSLLLLGLLLGRGWRAVARRRGPLAGVVSPLIFGYGYLLLTRPLAAMTLGLGMALFGLLAAAALSGLCSPARLATRVPPLLARALPPSQPFEAA